MDPRRGPERRHGRAVRPGTGTGIGTGTAPPVRELGTQLGGRSVSLSADFGVFSPDRVDDGTAMLLAAASRLPVTSAVADIGIGYGVLALGLLAADRAERAFGTDVDCVALWLAGLNARRLEVPLELAADPDPLAVPPTPLTVCNVPTHIGVEATRSLMGGLVQRAATGRLLAVVHRSLEQRYARYLSAAGLTVSTEPGPAHTVLDTGPDRLPKAGRPARR